MDEKWRSREEGRLEGKERSDLADELSNATKDLFADIFDAIHDLAHALTNEARDFVQAFEQLGNAGDLFEDFAHATEDLVDHLTHARNRGKCGKGLAEAGNQAEAHLEGFCGGKLAIEQAEGATEDFARATEFIEDFSTKLVKQAFAEIAKAFAFTDQVHHGFSGFSDDTVTELAKEVLSDLREFPVGAKELVFQEVSSGAHEVLFDITTLAECTKELASEVTRGGLCQARDVVEEILSDILESRHPNIL